MDLIREVEQAEHFRHSFVVRLRSDVILHAALPQMQNLRRAVYTNFKGSGAGDQVIVAHRDFAEAVFEMTRLPSASTCFYTRQQRELFNAICWQADSCACNLKQSLIFHNVTWVDFFFPHRIIRNW